jgi:hypothetical protein
MYLSFADDERGGFLGAAVIEARGMLDALTTANALGINPGGEVLTIDMPDGNIRFFPPEVRNKLLTRGDLEALGEVVRLGDIEEEELSGPPESRPEH